MGKAQTFNSITRSFLALWFLRYGFNGESCHAKDKRTSNLQNVSIPQNYDLVFSSCVRFYFEFDAFVVGCEYCFHCRRTFLVGSLRKYFYLKLDHNPKCSDVFSFDNWTCCSPRSCPPVASSNEAFFPLIS